MNREVMVRILLALALVGLLVGGFFATFERKNVTEHTAATGAALSNRFYALSLILHRLDVPVTSLTSVDSEQMPLHADDTLVIGDDPGRLDVDDATRIADWVRHGGHLVVPTGDDGLAVHTPLMDALGIVEAMAGTRACSELHSGMDGDHEVSLCGQRFRLTSAARTNIDVAIGAPNDGYLFARVHVGAGLVSLLVDLSPLAGHALEKPAAQRFALRLLAPKLDRGHVYLVYALDGPSFLKLLSVQGWPALISLSLLLLAWAVMRSARLGPLIPAPPLHRRALLEHVQAAGEFLYRRDAGRTLHSLARDAVLARCRRRDPASAMLNGEPLYERLAQRSGLESAQVAQAFQPPANAMAFRACMLTLARLRSRR